MLIIIGLSLAIAGAAVAGTTVLRALPRLSHLPVDDHQPVRERAVKERILRDRLHRKFDQWFSAVQRRTRTGFRGWVGVVERAYRRLRLIAQAHVAEKPGAAQVTCASAVAEADTARVEGAYDHAEEQYLACLKIDAKHREAYLGLAAVYRARHEDALAEETFRFLRKLYPDDTDITFNYADLLRAREKYPAALREMQHALAASPRNPKLLDFAIDLAIVSGRRAPAERWLAQLKEANPENQKLAEFAQRIAEIGA